ncbi:putative histidine kinase SlnCl1 [Hypoxylon sp. FL1150]|nr:putative histidine kinase SlnCl1 [Hypoxylon sp. FL1150]
MRVAIREQLAALVLFAVLVALAILSIPTWVYVNRFVIGIENNALSLTASLKAAQVSSEIELIQTTCNHIATRLLLQDALLSFYLGNSSDSVWDQAAADLGTALTSGNGVASSLLQARLYSRNQTGGDTGGLLSVTGANITEVKLPYTASDGSQAILSDTDSGYPPSLYPNITYYNSTDPDPAWPGHTAVVARPFPDVRIDSSVNGLVLGPLVINATYALLSLTIPIRQNSFSDAVLGYMTTVAEATSLINILGSKEGLGTTGSTLLIGPSTGWNRFSKYNLPANSSHEAASNFSSVDVNFVLPPRPMPGQADRHTEHNYASGNYDAPFHVSLYDAAFRAFTARNPSINNASSLLSTTNEQGVAVAVGYARPQTTLVNWTLIVEQDRSEAYIPINTLQHIMLACVFGTVGLTLLLVIPCAHLSVMPIRRLKSATEKSIAPPGYAEAYLDDLDYDDEDEEHHGSSNVSRKSGNRSFIRLKKLIRRHTRSRITPSIHDSEPRRQILKIPGKVNDRKHYVTDELTELTTTFNEMSDELLKQYTSLEEKVADRTRELEISKKAAEAANESKTLFIANISHELKTPLNGILGMCAVCMEEDDLGRVKQSLKTLYKSGDLLLHLLEDLLSFSKNQIGQQLSLEEREFRLGDIRSQVATIFDKQVREGSIDFSVAFFGTERDTSSSPERTEIDEKLPAIGPLGTGRLKDMCLWGDQHRILQVLINLVSNSLKFTPAGGKVSVRIRCLREIETPFDVSRTSSLSKTGSNRPGRNRHRMGSGSNKSSKSKSSADLSTSTQYKGGGTALSINPLDPKATPHVRIRERSPTPPPPSAKSFLFEFEVEDSGPGIPEHMQQRVFEPFVQGDLGLSKKFGGTGLGLSICQQLANLMGGGITLKSTVGVGTTFIMQIPLKYTKDRASSTASSSLNSRAPSISSSINDDTHKNSITLPQNAAEVKVNVLDKQPRLVGLSQPFFAARPAAKPPPTPTPDDRMKTIEAAKASKGDGKLRVLVAEDNPTNIEVVSRMLKLEDVYDVTIAQDGQEAYELVKQNMENNLHFDLIFMDIQMPNLDGLQSTRLIRKMGYSAPIVALTAFSEESNIKDCMESGMNEFLSKPIRRPALKQVLKKFATIPEEPETASQFTRKSTPDGGDRPVVTQPPNEEPISPRTTDFKGQTQPNGAHPPITTAQ